MSLLNAKIEYNILRHTKNITINQNKIIDLNNELTLNDIINSFKLRCSTVIISFSILHTDTMFYDGYMSLPSNAKENIKLNRIDEYNNKIDVIIKFEPSNINLTNLSNYLWGILTTNINFENKTIKFNCMVPPHDLIRRRKH
jgi:hypothetical protein